MAKIKTFIDSGILIAAIRGDETLSQKAMGILGDVDRILVTSEFVQLEVIPKAKHNKKHAEVKFYENFLDATKNDNEFVLTTRSLVMAAQSEAEATGLSAVDALHVAAAAESSSDELWTVEKKTKPIFRTQLVKVHSIRDLSS